jgi:predicted aldo/keto reductase-like oxidoreductase
MKYRPFGNTKKDVSVVGFGGMRFKAEEYESGDYTLCASLVLRAHELGINYFDTAPDYCDGQSELIFGTAFKELDRSTFYVSTKCGLWNATTTSGARKMIEQSLKKMDLEYIDFYNMWSIKTMDDYKEFMKKGGVYEAAVQAKEEGLIKHICFSTHLSGEEIASIAHDGVFEAVTLGYNALNFSFRQKGIDACHKAGLGIVTMNPLGGGIIPSYPEYFSFLQTDDDSLAVSALKFIISQNKATVALTGISSIEELEENVLAGENIKEASPSLLEELSSHLSTELNSLCTTCAYCDSCPEQIPIPHLLDSYNLYLLSKGDSKQMFQRMANHWNVDPSWASHCTSCGQCESLCTQKLPIIERLETIASYL